MQHLTKSELMELVPGDRLKINTSRTIYRVMSKSIKILKRKISWQYKLSYTDFDNTHKNKLLTINESFRTDGVRRYYDVERNIVETKYYKMPKINEHISNF